MASSSSSSSSSSSAPSSPTTPSSPSPPTKAATKAGGGEEASKETFVVALEGNIGVGKSTMARSMAKEYPSQFRSRLESISQRFNRDLLYNSPAKYSFAMQWGQLCTRLTVAQMIRPCSEPFFLWDRSIIGDFVFALTNYLLKNINDTEMDVYMDKMGVSGYDDFIAKCGTLATTINAVLYVDGGPKLCHTRMLSLRKDNAEKDVPVEYLEKLDSVHFCVLRDIISVGRLPVYVKLTPTGLTTFRSPKEDCAVFENMAAGKLAKAAFVADGRGSDSVECALKATSAPNDRFPRVRYYDSDSIRPVWAALAAGRPVHLT